MLSEFQFRELVSGRWRGPVAAALRGMLAVAEAPYRWEVARRNRRFDRGVVKAAEFDAPIISVGNLTVGGTGKTPFVALVARLLRERGAKVTLISRGYGRRARPLTPNPSPARGEGNRSPGPSFAGGEGRAPNDEWLELATRLPGVPHLQNPDRVAAARQALAADPRQVLLLDDAFQHRRIARDLDIVLLDALEPWGYGHLLPRGLLREPVESLKRAHLIGLSRSDEIDAAARDAIRSRAMALSPQAGWLELVHKQQALVTHAGQREPLSAWHNRPVAAFCGIGNPAGFRRTLERCGLLPVAWREFPDHFAYPARSLEELDHWAAAANDAEAVVCTAKDLVKIPREQIGGRPLYALEIDVEITLGQDRLLQELDLLISRLNSLP